MFKFKSLKTQLAIGGMVFLSVGAWLYLPSAIPGCNASNKAVPISNTKPMLDTIQTTAKAASADLPKRATAIDKDADKAMGSVTPADRVVIGPPMADIKTQTHGVREDAALVGTIAPQTETVVKAVDVEQSSSDAKDKRIAQLEDAQKSELHRLLALTIVLAVVGVGVAGALIYVGSTSLGIAVGIGSSGVLAVSVLLIQYAVVVAIGGGVLLLAGLGYLGYMIYEKEKANGTLAVATRELAQGHEVVKDHLSRRNVAALYGVGTKPGLMDDLQSPSTRAIVAQLRGKNPHAVRLAVPKHPSAVPGEPVSQPVAVWPE